MTARQRGPERGRAAGMVVDDGGRPVTDEGGRPAFQSGDDGGLVLDDAGTEPVGAVTATGTNSPPAAEPTPYVDPAERS